MHTLYTYYDEQGAFLVHPPIADIQQYFVCEATDLAGTACGRRFPTAYAMHVHTVRMHATCPGYHTCVRANQCPWCEHVYSTYATTCAHVRKRVLGQQCNSRGSTVITTLKPARKLDCPCCAFLWPSLDTYHAHIRQHFDS
eukprot:1667902-Heterocapsa_arctica.AAC.1